MKHEPCLNQELEPPPKRQRTRRRPVCACGHERMECADCERGPVQLLAKGEEPTWKEVPIVMKKVAVCKGCREERATCSSCGKGYMEEVEKGNSPEFNEIEDTNASKVLTEPKPGQIACIY